MPKTTLQTQIHDLWTKTKIPLTQEHIQQVSQVDSSTLVPLLEELIADGAIARDPSMVQSSGFYMPGQARPAEGVQTVAEWTKKKARIEEAKRRILEKRRAQAKANPAPSPSQAQPQSTPLTAPAPKQPKVSTTTEAKRSASEPAPTQRDSNPSLRDAALDAQLKREQHARERDVELDRATSQKGSKQSFAPEESLAIALKSAKKLTNKAFSELDQAASAREGEKSPVISAALSLFLGPLGWLYAGSFKEAIPAFLIGLGLASLLPSLLLVPLMMVAMPASAIGGWLYAWQYNQQGERSTLFLGDGKTDDT